MKQLVWVLLFSKKKQVFAECRGIKITAAHNQLVWRTFEELYSYEIRHAPLTIILDHYSSGLTVRNGAEAWEKHHETRLKSSCEVIQKQWLIKQFSCLFDGLYKMKMFG